jgi:hypothetical protein
MMTTYITVEQLQQHAACKEGIDQFMEFARKYPDGVPFTKEVVKDYIRQYGVYSIPNVRWIGDVPELAWLQELLQQ